MIPGHGTDVSVWMLVPWAVQGPGSTAAPTVLPHPLPALLPKREEDKESPGLSISGSASFTNNFWHYTEKKMGKKIIIILCIYQQTTRQQLPKSGLRFIRQVLWECNGFYDRYPFILSVLYHRLFENTRKIMLRIPYPKETRLEQGDISIYSCIFNCVFTERRKDALNL